MPKSRIRKKEPYTPPPTRSPKKKHSPPWVAPVMVALFVLGVLWLSTYYVSGGEAPGMRALPDLGNMLIGFGFIIAGFAFATQWR